MSRMMRSSARFAYFLTCSSTIPEEHGGTIPTGERSKAWDEPVPGSSGPICFGSRRSVLEKSWNAARLFFLVPPRSLDAWASHGTPFPRAFPGPTGEHTVSHDRENPSDFRGNRFPDQLGDQSREAGRTPCRFTPCALSSLDRRFHCAPYAGKIITTGVYILGHAY